MEVIYTLTIQTIMLLTYFFTIHLGKSITHHVSLGKGREKCIYLCQCVIKFITAFQKHYDDMSKRELTICEIQTIFQTINERRWLTWLVTMNITWILTLTLTYTFSLNIHVTYILHVNINKPSALGVWGNVVYMFYLLIKNNIFMHLMHFAKSMPTLYGIT